MRVAALIAAAIASLAVDAGIFIYWIGSDLACLTTCPPADSYTGAWLRLIDTTLSPGLLLSVVASALTIIALSAQRRTAPLIMVIATPLIIAVAVILILRFVVGGLTPIASPPLPQDPLAPLEVSRQWLQFQIYAALPLALWPFATFLLALRRPAQ
jgi:hypothetical protein